MFNARALGFKQSALKGITRNKGFMVILPAIVVIQILIVQFGKTMFRTQPISVKDWIIIALTTSLVLWGGEIFRLYRSTVDKSVDLPDESPFS